LNLTDDFNGCSLPRTLSNKSLLSNTSIKIYHGSVIDADVQGDDITILKTNYKGYTGSMISVNNKDRTYYVRHGHGTQTWPDGANYEGQWKFGRLCGYGIFNHSSGDKYKGNFEMDKAQGHGVYVSKSGQIYEGQWHQDMKHGQGEELNMDGSKFKGEYVRGRKLG
jgi:hypothetical protein